MAIAEAGTPKLVVKLMSSPWGELTPEIQRRLETFLELKAIGIVPFSETHKQGQAIYLVREYVDASSLMVNRIQHPEVVETIAIALLEVLYQMQAQLPGIVHGNIKPANIFLRPTASQDAELVLTDFALPLVSQWEANLTAAEESQFGFVAAEQVVGNPTPASDNYAIGAVLLSLLSGTPSHQFATLACTENAYEYPVQEILLQQPFPMSSFFMDWLTIMLAPNIGDRYPDARTALSALRRIQVIARPRVRLNPSIIRLQATQFGEQLQAVIEVRNLMPGTILRGQWRVTSYWHDAGDWIEFSPNRVFGNETTVLLSIDTQKLLAGQQYVRELVFQSNSERPILAVSLVVQTGSLKLPVRPLPVLHLTGLLVVGGFLPIALSIIL
ncbi:MAG: hypothetical protein AAGD09_20875 [Cyanobacteria bacterium P01_F01_bin.56]